MEKFLILLGYLAKQEKLIERLHQEVSNVDLANYEKRYMFALKVQQFYTAIEDLLKQVAKAFENHVDTLSSYHKELLHRLSTDIPKIRPALLTQKSFLFLDKLRAFRHFIRHAYDCELEQNELRLVQNRINENYSEFQQDIKKFIQYILEITEK